ncbi:hypothetical protein A9R10_07735 [Aeromonas piscicola]|nr:hypothetical protein A9R10_07735 [Aeromonas piscicola]
MTVVVKASLGIKILPLKTQGSGNLGDLFPPHIAIGAIAHLPSSRSIVTSQRQRGTKVVKLIMEYFGILPFPFQLHQWLEAARLIDKAAVLLIGTTFIITKLITAFGNKVVGLPQEFGDVLALCPPHRLANTAAKGVVVIIGRSAIRQFSPDQLMLAVIVITGNQRLAFATALDGQSAKFVVLKMAIATQQQPVTLSARPIKLTTRSLAQQVARRIMQEPLGQFTTHLQQAVQRVVTVVLLPLHAVIDLQQIAGVVIAVTPLTGDLLAPLQSQSRQAPLLVIFILLGQRPLAAAHFQSAHPLVASQLGAVQINPA